MPDMPTSVPENAAPIRVDGTSRIDPRIIDLIVSAHNSVVHLIRPDQSDPPTVEHLTLALQTMKITAETAWKLADCARIVSEKEKLWAETEKITAETERIKATKK